MFCYLQHDVRDLIFLSTYFLSIPPGQCFNVVTTIPEYDGYAKLFLDLYIKLNDIVYCADLKFGKLCLGTDPGQHQLISDEVEAASTSPDTRISVLALGTVELLMRVVG